MAAQHRVRRFGSAALVVVGAALLAVSVAAVVPASNESVTAAPAAPQSAAGSLHRAIVMAQERLRHQPQDPLTWAQLGSAYVEQARITADPSYYPKAQGALQRSLHLQPRHNGAALIGMGALANARHEFTAGRDWGRKAVAELPDTAQAYGVLVDAYTQLGDADKATVAVQRMLDHKPGVAAFTRASYDLEQHGRTGEARAALERALADATSTSDVVFCRYYLGELAFNAGDLDGAERQYEQGLMVDGADVSLLDGRAKVAAARGHVAQALADYRIIVSRVPLPQYIQEYAQLLQSTGHADIARQQYEVLAQQQKLLAVNGATDDLTATSVAADRGDAAGALRTARAEWGRRHSMLVADAMAWALHLNGKDAEALGYADRAAALGWRNAAFSFHRGMILAGLGRTGPAVQALSTALEINPHFSVRYAPQARATLAALRGGR